MNEILATLNQHKLIVAGAMGGAFAAPWLTKTVAGWAPSFTGTPLGKFGLQLVLSGVMLYAASLPKLPTTAFVAASAPFIAGAIGEIAPAFKSVTG